MSARTKEQTRQLMLATGKELLEEHGVPEAMPIKLSDVLARLRLTTGAAYHIWDSQNAYREELTLYCAQNMTTPGPDVQEVIRECSEDDFSSTVRAAARRYLQLYVDGDVYTRLYLWTIKNPSQEITETATAAYDSNTSFATLCQEVIVNCGRRIVDTVPVEEVAAATIALLDGFSLRVRFDSGDTRGSFSAFGNAVANYLGAVTEPE